MAINILISDPLSEDGIYPLRQEKELDLNIDIKTGLQPEELKAIIANYDVLLVRSQTKVTRDIIEAADNLKLIGRAGVGVDNIDLEAATEKGIIVVNAPDGNTNSAAEHTTAMIFALARHIPQAFITLKEGRWDRKKFVGVELKNKTLGVIGFGRIGQEVAHRAKGNRMNVIAYDPFLTAEKAEKAGVDYGSVEDVAKVADFITVHTPLLDSTRHMINEDIFNVMKDGVRIINCARGGIIDEEALYNAIESGKVAGAALDVMEEEPFVGNRLLDLPQVIATPHLGASTVEAQESVAVDVSNDILSYFNVGTVQNPVNMPSVPKDVVAKVEPFFELGEKIGAFAMNLTEEAVNEINIYYSGDVANYDVRPLTNNTVKGVLTRNLGNHVNNVNARYLADRNGIKISEQKSTQARAFLSSITVEVITENEKHSVKGTLLNGLGARIVQVDQYVVDVVPEGNLLFIKHTDKPGVIGRVGTSLAEQNVNIATMQVGRADEGGDAIMMLAIDNTVESLDFVIATEGVFDAKEIKL
ncbi:D-3-phosphoglycerate dehydrogenase [Kurthia sp. 3B1D]|uniref:D-3-phosphoglycerate dehydrogenase n=2 Tax=Kurthia TaxID=1649 RepID=A0A433RRK0_9BACL|nr:MULTISPECIES: phosphoglycerate dehydrogenase [unclassified Kurthia]RUS53792.1 D-3-phosphoglycerate dehydrogenase [Kurthia sp. 3B1D]HIX43581.1 phosphoglycerate dehydrogenase [Candidatus Kurthia intestinigallinarum]